jgi:hypothetical protein
MEDERIWKRLVDTGMEVTRRGEINMEWFLMSLKGVGDLDLLGEIDGRDDPISAVLGGMQLLFRSSAVCSTAI